MLTSLPYNARKWHQLAQGLCVDPPAVLANHFANLDMATRLRKRTQKDEVDDLIRRMQGKATIAEKEVALKGYVDQLLNNKRDTRLQAFYRSVLTVIPQIAATH